MSDIGETIAKRRGRKAETPAQRLARLERDVELAKQAVKEADARRFATIGAALWEETENDAEFKARVLSVLHRRVTNKTGRADIAPLLAGGSDTTPVVAADAGNGQARAA
jgi:hypothetical protein